MAYNREWDQGKEDWGYDDGGWDDGSNRGNVRRREDDYYGGGEGYYGGDNKRRRYNEGGHDSQAYNTGGWDGPGNNGYNQHQDAQWSGEDRSRGGFKKRHVASEASPHVIFLGLDPDFTEADLQAYVTGHGHAVESVTIIRDRATGSSKGFGFAQFASAEHAKGFVEPFFPFVSVPPPASHGASATAAFYKALEAGAPHNGRRVKIDYSQSINPSERSRRPMQSNDGTRDIGNTQAPVLLFRGLDPLSGPQAIATAMKNSSGPGKEGAKGMKRVILIKDKTTLASWSFAFVEFVDTQSAAATLGATMSPQIHPAGFRISDVPVAASFAHPDSFIMVDAMHRDEACLVSSHALGGQEKGWVRYWDEGSTVAVIEFEVAAPVQVETNKEKEKKKKKALEKPATPAAPSALPVSGKPVTLSFNKRTIPKPNGAAATTPAVAGVVSLADEGDEEQEDNAHANDDAKVAAARKVAPLIASKKVVNNIAKWNQAQGALSSGNPEAKAPHTAAASTPITAPPSESAKPANEDGVSFSDATGKICLLCARQFKSCEQLARHNKESDLHKKNLQDAALCEVAKGKVNASKAKATAAQAATSETPKYRDRASERRVMHNQPDIPLPAQAEKPAFKKRFEGPPPPPSPPPLPVAPAQDQNNVGNKLLKMMGWKEGEGLGVEGEGRVDPIQTAIFAQGVGLGASKGKEVGKYQEGFAGYKEMARDMTRERYNS